ncbi:hypothetical protein KAZ57_02955 [Patescibacteria group bacterium]|nr:hypothetical protein [Patescibacteria group bacterium]
MENNKSLIMGLWKFHERVGNKDLLEVANEWASDEKYVQIYIRKVSKDQYGIGFAYESEGTKESQGAYMDATSDTLKRKFGNDLVGWDIATTAQLVKGF